MFQGRVGPLYEPIEFGIADKLMMRAIAHACQIDQLLVAKKFQNAGDLGKVVEELSQSHIPPNRKIFTVHEVYTKLVAIAHTTGEGSQEQKDVLLVNILQSVDPLSARYIVKILLDKLRLGFSDMTILDAFSWMLTGDKSVRNQLEDAYNVRPDIGFIATTMKTAGLKGFTHVDAKVGVPILASLCQRLPTASEMIKKMGTVCVEPKYDGVRVQIHVKKSKIKTSHFAKASRDKQKFPLRPSEKSQCFEGQANVRTFSRNLEDTTAMFPELEDGRNQLDAQEVILDSEAVGIDPKTGDIVSFQETTTRKRKHNIQLMQDLLPLRFYVFDILAKDGKNLLGLPLSERRSILEKTIRSGPILSISPHIVTDDADTIKNYHEDQRKKGLEGVVVKKWDSPYEPGRRGFSWVKFKEEEGKTGKLSDTIDAVIMGYYVGEGKRSGFGIGAFLVGVKKDEEFVTITKIGTGVTDAKWKELKIRLDKLKADTKPKEYKETNKTLVPNVWIMPSLVVEIAGDDLTRSPSHGAGFAVRFPRLIRLREDKGPEQVTTIDEVKVMFEQQ